MCGVNDKLLILRRHKFTRRGILTGVYMKCQRSSLWILTFPLFIYLTLHLDQITSVFSDFIHILFQTFFVHMQHGSIGVSILPP